MARLLVIPFLLIASAASAQQRQDSACTRDVTRHCRAKMNDGDQLVLRASNSAKPATVGKVRLAINEGLTGWVARERRLLAISREAYHDPRFKLFKDLPDAVRATREIVVKAGNAAGVSFMLNGKEIPAQGNEGEVKTFIFEATGLRTQ